MRRSTLQEALALLDLGWSIVPLRAGGKKPLIAWRGWQHRLPLAVEIERWLERWPDANIGIVTGAVSRLLVIDVDPLRGADRMLRALEQQFAPLPPTLAVTTGGGGRHLYFRIGVASLASSINGIELHGDGGYVVAPPSLHLTGRCYAWEGERPSARVLPAMAPGWLLDLARPGIPAWSGERRILASGPRTTGPVRALACGPNVVRPLVAV